MNDLAKYGIGEDSLESFTECYFPVALRERCQKHNLRIKIDGELKKMQKMEIKPKFTNEELNLIYTRLETNKTEWGKNKR